MKIGIVHVTVEDGSESYTEMVTRNFDRAKRDDTEIVHRYVRHLRRATDTALAYPTLLNKVDVVHEFQQFAEDGVDAVMVACSGDPGVAEARSLLDIPVVGPMEAAIGLACGYGRNLGVLTVAERPWAAYQDQVVRDFGLGQRFVGVGKLPMSTREVFTTGFSTPDVVVGHMRDTARGLVDRGAEAILIGSAGLSTFASSVGFTGIEDPAVPVFDVLVAGLKVTELRVDLTQKTGLLPTGRSGWTERYPDKDRDRLNGAFGWFN